MRRDEDFIVLIVLLGLLVTSFLGIISLFIWAALQGGK